eukprot:jgi/Chlat1/2457/Chrsp171S02346
MRRNESKNSLPITINGTSHSSSNGISNGNGTPASRRWTWLLRGLRIATAAAVFCLIAQAIAVGVSRTVLSPAQTWPPSSISFEQAAREAGWGGAPTPGLALGPTLGLQHMVLNVDHDLGRQICDRHWAKGLQDQVGTDYLHNLRVFIAMNLHDNERVGPHLIFQLQRLLSWLNPSNIYVSIYESGSNDSTPALLALLHSLLQSMKVAHIINGSKDDVRGGKQRIEFLAQVRNKAIIPLMQPDSPRYDKVFFMNDVFHCAEDSLLLLLHDAHIASGFDIGDVDWRERRIRYYDYWVGRDITGDRFMMWPPYSLFPPNQARIQEGLPFPVYCTWNGMVSINAEIFQDKQIQFRFRQWRGECSSSEMTHFCEDIWKVYQNSTKVVIDPRVLVTYELSKFAEIDLARQKQVPNNRAPYDIGIFPNPWKPGYEPGVPLLQKTLASLRSIPTGYGVPNNTVCCPMMDGSSWANEGENCYWEPAINGVYHFNPCPEDVCLRNHTCPNVPNAQGGDKVYLAITIREGETVPDSLARRVEQLGEKLGGRLRLHTVSWGPTEHTVWKAHLMGTLWSMRIQPFHEWAKAHEDPAQSHWNDVRRQCGKSFAFVIDAHREWCPADVLSHLHDTERCAQTHFHPRPHSPIVMCHNQGSC